MAVFRNTGTKDRLVTGIHIRYRTSAIPACMAGPLPEPLIFTITVDSSVAASDPPGSATPARLTEGADRLTTPATFTVTGSRCHGGHSVTLDLRTVLHLPRGGDQDVLVTSSDSRIPTEHISPGSVRMTIDLDDATSLTRAASVA